MGKFSSRKRQAFALRRQTQRALWPSGLLLQRCQTTVVKGVWRENSAAAHEMAQLEKDAKKWDSSVTGWASEECEQLTRAPSLNLLASCEPSWLRHLAWTHFPFLSDPFNCLLFQHSLMLTRKTGALGSKLSLPLLVLEKGVFILWRHRNLYIFYSIINSLKYHFILEIFPSWFPTLIPASSSLYPQNNIICIYWAFASLWFVIFILFCECPI